MRIDRGQKIKVKSITFDGTGKLSAKQLRKAMKNTKQKNIFRVLKRSKYIEADYKEDLQSVVDKYKEKGYRDARVFQIRSLQTTTTHQFKYWRRGRRKILLRIY